MEADDFELQKEPGPPPVPVRRPPSLLPWIVGVVVVAAAVAAFVLLPREPAPSATGGAATTEALVEPPKRLGVDVEPVDLPPLDESDPFVRQLVRGLTSHPRVAAWLATDNLIRNFTVVVENISAGGTPSGHLRVLKPPGSFEAVESGGTLFIHPRTFSRYDSIGDAVNSVNAAGAAKIYSTLKPRIEDAWREIGRGASFDAALQQSIITLVTAPSPQGDVSLVESGGIYQFNDPRLERLTHAQKQLLRMGPRNVRIVQRKLREIGIALGIPEEVLKAPR
jgi:hypothetical protein